MNRIIIIIMILVTLSISSLGYDSRKSYKAVDSIVDVYGVPESISRTWVTSIMAWSNEYNLSPMRVASIVGIECSFNIHHIHDKVRVYTKKGIKRTRAVGAGIIYPLWEQQLKDRGIDNGSALKKIDINVKALCIILSIKDRRRYERRGNLLENIKVLSDRGVF